MILACANIMNVSITQSRQLSLLASAKKVSSNHIVWKGYSGYFLWHVGKDLYEETAKSMEGVLLDEYYVKAKVEGCSFEVMWQDGDSSPESSVAKYHPDRVFIWGRRLDVSSSRLPFHIRYFEINIGDFFYYCIIYFSY